MRTGGALQRLTRVARRVAEVLIQHEWPKLAVSTLRTVLEPVSMGAEAQASTVFEGECCLFFHHSNDTDSGVCTDKSMKKSADKMEKGEERRQRRQTKAEKLQGRRERRRRRRRCAAQAGSGLLGANRSFPAKYEAPEETAYVSRELRCSLLLSLHILLLLWFLRHLYFALITCCVPRKLSECPPPCLNAFQLPIASSMLLSSGALILNACSCQLGYLHLA